MKTKNENSIKTVESVELIAAVHTPFKKDGSLNLDAVEKQVAHLLKNNINSVFVGGSTGECHSLTFEERKQLTKRWMDVSRGTPIKVLAHVGSNCLEDARELAHYSESVNVAAISAHSPSYFRPDSLDMLVAICAEIASAAPKTPFYFYDIPALTFVKFSMPDFLQLAAKRIPNFAGIKYTNSDLMDYQFCLNAFNGKYDILYGVDEWLLAAIALGGRGAIGSSYNYMAPVYSKMITAFESGNLEEARKQQFHSAQVIKLLAGYGYLGASKAVMKMLGVDIGQTRLPVKSLSKEQIKELEVKLDKLGFWDWIK
jgi:N-acetylneuraminate lyase